MSDLTPQDTPSAKPSVRHFVCLTGGVVLLLAAIVCFAAGWSLGPLPIGLLPVVPAIFLLVEAVGGKSRPAPSVKTARRRFIASAASFAQNEGMQALSDKMQNSIATFTGKRNPRSKLPVLPAGAVSLERYTELCTACMDCVPACPQHLLEPPLKLTLNLQPSLSYRTGWCPTDCTRCNDACPTGALQPLTPAEKAKVQTGYAVWIMENCISYNEHDCSACAENCPQGCIQMYRNGRKLYPVITNRNCTGCGACENNCPAMPLKAIYVEAYGKHRVRQISESEVPTDANTPSNTVQAAPEPSASSPSNEAPV
ncbi:MAG: hypothetical protein PUH21_00475 [Prevotellaceae bacterium]|nr:hypothetical protein [Prevotellaceae bacterium]MDY3856879.1 hypothetical protein [Bacteroidaceae bacterium]